MSKRGKITVSSSKLTEKQRLAIYDRLRDAHNIIKFIYLDELIREDDDAFDLNAIEAVDNVLYLAEGHFTRPE